MQSLRQMVLLLIASAGLALTPAIKAAEPPSEPILRIDPGEHTAQINRIATDAAGRWMASASDDKTVRVWNLADGRLATTLRFPIGKANEGKANAVAMSPDGQLVAVGGWTGWDWDQTASIYLFDRASGRVVRRIGGLQQLVQHLAFTPDGRTLAVTLLEKEGVRVFNVADGRLLASDREYGARSLSAHWSTDGRLVTTSLDGLLRLYRFDGTRLTLMARQAAPGGRQPLAARFSPDGKRIAVGFIDTPAFNLLDGNNLTLLATPDTSGVNAGLYAVAWSLDGSDLYAAGSASTGSQFIVRRWTAAGTGSASNWPVAGSAVFALAGLPSGRLVFATAEPSWGIVGANGERQLFHAPATSDFRAIRDIFKLSADGGIVRFGYDGTGRSNAAFDIVSRQFLDPNTPNLFPTSFFAPGQTVTDASGTTAPKLNGQPLKLYPYEISRNFGFLTEGNGVAVAGDWSLRVFERNGRERWMKDILGSTWAVNASRDGRWVVAALGDGTIRWYKASDGTEMLALYPHPDHKRWVMWTPGGYYDASPGAEDLIGWHLNRGKEQSADFFPASRFRGLFYRPDVMARVLETGSEAEALRLANADAGRRSQPASIVQVLPPVVEIVAAPPSGTFSQSEITVKVTVRSPADAPVIGVKVRVNGILQSGTRDLGIAKVPAAPVATGPGTDTRDVILKLPPENADVQIFAENRNGVSVPATMRLAWTGTKAAPPPTATADNNAFKPKLYVLAIGVTKYKNPEYNLGLAAKDAKDFTDSLKAQKGLLYRDVEVKLLTDEKATKDDVLDGLEWLKQQVTARDVGILFMAGHGMNDNTGNYYYLPHNINLDQLLRTGVAYNDIKITLNSLAGKAVFFIDTCHSGNALGTAKTRGVGTDVNGIVSELASAENGVVVFTASTGKQLSQESAEWGNGAFTKAVVEGLNGKADFQKNGKITLKGLDFYVAERVKELTKGQQSPTSISPSGIGDFPLAILR